jgi:hypothetical protein
MRDEDLRGKQGVRNLKVVNLVLLTYVAAVRRIVSVLAPTNCRRRNCHIHYRKDFKVLLEIARRDRLVQVEQ